MENNDLRSRMISIMRELSSSYGRYKWLEAQTDVPAQRWANLYNLRQQPSVEQVEALGKLAPNLLEWMVTGKANSYQVTIDDPSRISKLFVWAEKRDEIESLAKKQDEGLLQVMTAEEHKLTKHMQKLKEWATLSDEEARRSLSAEDLQGYKRLKRISERRERDGHKSD